MSPHTGTALLLFALSICMQSIHAQPPPPPPLDGRQAILSARLVSALQQQYANDVQGARLVSNGAELAAALRDNAVRAILVVSPVLELNDSHFPTRAEGSVSLLQPAQSVTQIRRNLTIAGPSRTWPLLRLNANRVVKIGQDVTLQIVGCILELSFSSFLLRSAGLDLLAASDVGSNARVVLRDAAIFFASGVDGSAGDMSWMTSLQRPPLWPGYQRVNFTATQSPDCSRDPTAPLLQRCWAFKGIFEDLALSASTGATAGGFGDSVPLNYDVFVIDTAFVYDTVFSQKTITDALAGGPSANETATALATGTRVRNGTEFVAALADPSVSVVVLQGLRLWLAEADFAGQALPIRVDRNLTLLGADGVLWPQLTVLTERKVRLGRGVTVMIRRVVVEIPITEFTFRAPSLGLFAASASDSGAKVVMHNAAILFGVGLLNAYGYNWIVSIRRPAASPGLQLVNPFVPDPNCVEDPNAPAMQKCWITRGMFVDVAWSVVNIDPVSGFTLPLYHDLYFLDSIFMFDKYIPEVCLEADSPVACFLAMNQDASAAVLRGGPPPPPRAALGGAAAGTPSTSPAASGAPGLAADGPGGKGASAPAGAAGSGGVGSGAEAAAAGGGSSDTVGIAVGCAIGGAVLVAAALAGALLWRRRRQARAARLQQERKERELAAGSTGSASPLAVVSVGPAGGGGGGGHPAATPSGSAAPAGAGADAAPQQEPLKRPGPELQSTVNSSVSLVAAQVSAATTTCDSGGVIRTGTDGSSWLPLVSSNVTTHYTGASHSPVTDGQPLSAPLPPPRPPPIASDAVTPTTPFRDNFNPHVNVQTTDSGMLHQTSSAACALSTGAVANLHGSGTGGTGSSSAEAPPFSAAAAAAFISTYASDEGADHANTASAGDDDFGSKTMRATVLKALGSMGRASAPTAGNPTAAAARQLVRTGGTADAGTTADTAARGGRTAAETSTLDSGGASCSTPPVPSTTDGAAAGTEAGGGREAVVKGAQPPCPPTATGGDTGVAPDAAAAADTDADVVTLLPEVLGKGAFGRVVAGRYRGQDVAVKQLLTEHDLLPHHHQHHPGAADALIQAFVHEVEVLGRVHHPNIVSLYAACLLPPNLALVMERCETSLDRLLFGGYQHRSGGDGGGGVPACQQAPPGPQLLPLRKLLHIAIEICRGLEYLHPTITHRDLKPANVLLNRADSDTPEVKLSDFGLARIRASTLRTAQPETGTPAFMGPELFDVTNEVVSHRADMYSFGVLLWVMLSGQQPWKDFPIVVLAFKVSRGARLRLDSETVGGEERCPAKLKRLICACWDADPQRRPAAAEVLKELMVLQEQLTQQQQQQQLSQRLS